MLRVARRGRPVLDPPMVVALVAGLLLTGFVSGTRHVRFAYDNPSLHVALETAEGLIGALLAYLAVQRFRARRSVRDAILAWTFTVLAVTNLVLSAVPMVTSGSRPAGTLTWAVVGLRLCGAAGLCAAAFVDGSKRLADRELRRRLVGVTGLVVGMVALGAGAAGTWMADVVEPSIALESSGRPRIVGHPVVLVVQVVAVVLYAASAAGFRRQARREADHLMRWLAAGAVMAAFARLNFFLFPSLYSNLVYTGDVLRLGSYLWFLIGATCEIDAYRQDQTRLAVMEDRRRMARDLHDGLVQELSFIRSQTAAVAAGMDLPGVAEHVATAAGRALEEARRAVEALAEASAGDLGDVLRVAAQEIALRSGVAVELDAVAVPEVPSETGHALARVVREATSNAVRHGKAATVSVRLRADRGRLHLVVEDDGKGFDPDTTSTDGFGLKSMRERVENLGGSFGVRSRLGRGTRVEVSLPLR